MDLAGRIFPVSPWIEYAKTRDEIELRMRIETGRAKETRHKRCKTELTGQKKIASGYIESVKPKVRKHESSLQLCVRELKTSVKRMKETNINSQDKSTCLQLRTSFTTAPSPDLRYSLHIYNGFEGDSFCSQKRDLRASLCPSNTPSKRVTFYNSEDTVKRTMDSTDLSLSESECDMEEQLEDRVRQVSPTPLVEIPRREKEEKRGKGGYDGGRGNSAIKEQRNTSGIYYLPILSLHRRYYAHDPPSSELFLGHPTVFKLGVLPHCANFRLYPTAEQAWRAKFPAQRVLLMKVRPTGMVVQRRDGEVESCGVIPIEVAKEEKGCEMARVSL